MEHQERRESDMPTHADLGDELRALRADFTQHRTDDHGQLDEVIELFATALWGSRKPAVEGGGRRSDEGLISLAQRGFPIRIPRWVSSAVVLAMVILVIQLIAVFTGVNPADWFKTLG